MFKPPRFLDIPIKVLYAALGSGPRRRINRGELEQAIGKRWTAFVMSLPVVLLAVWLAVWAYARIEPSENVTDFGKLPGFESLNAE